MYQINLVEKYLPTGKFKQNLINSKKILNLSVEDIINKYSGFEGEVISFFMVDNFKHTEIFIKDCMELKQQSNCQILHIFSDSFTTPSSLQYEALKVGYDVGVCIEDAAYSSIFNEILFGEIKELFVYKDFLNENFLFEDFTLAKRYVELHDELSRQGKDVEDWMEMKIYEIWKQKD